MNRRSLLAAAALAMPAVAHAQQGLTPIEQAEFRRLLERIRDNLSDAPQG